MGRLDDHLAKIEKHTGDLEDHLEQLDDHAGKLATHSHQLDLAKKAMDKDLAGGYGTEEIKGRKRDMLRDWDAENSQDLENRRKTQSQEDARSRRRLMSRPKSHTVVLEALSEE